MGKLRSNIAANHQNFLLHFIV